jgi:hypothetical protein
MLVHSVATVTVENLQELFVAEPTEGYATLGLRETLPSFIVLARLAFLVR